MTYATLYSRDSMGRVRIWKMEQDQNRYRTVSGLEDGEKVTSEWTLAKPKNVGKANATTGEEQASKEIENKYKKQLKTGYFADKNEIDNMSYVEPMLAKNYKDYRDKISLESGKYCLQMKLNGNRCVITKQGMFSRKGEEYVACPHINESLKEFFGRNPDAVLDGELFNEDLRQQLNELSKLVRRTVNITKDDLEKSREIVKFYVYDGYGFDGLDESAPYSQRKEWIDQNVLEYDYIEEVPSYTINSVDDLDMYYNEFVNQGHEGAILRFAQMPYEHKRSKNLLKIKPEDSDDAIITDVKEGEGNWAGTGKIFSLLWNNEEFDATLKGSFEQGVDVWKNRKNWIGKKVEFLYNGLTGLGTPNFARVDINNCLKEDR